jgi:3-hydroxyacyl-[acyl-carrier-protein] dehydratase
MSTQCLHSAVIERLPYGDPFLFVDKIVELDDHHIVTEYTFRQDSYFYKGHFKGNPVTPGVILLEMMGQGGLVAFGIYLLGLHLNKQPFTPMLSWLEADFLQPVLPGETVILHSEKIYLRQNTLKCKLVLSNINKQDIVLVTASCRFAGDF